MKKFLMVAMAIIIACGSSVYAADKYEKSAKKEAKRLAKENWQVAPGAQPLEMQLAKSFRMKDEVNDEGEPKWYIGDAMSIGENYDGAKLQAEALARQGIAAQIQSAIAAEIKTTGGNAQQGGDNGAATALKTVTKSTEWITNTIGKVITVVECYQILPNKNRNVRVVLAYNEKTALNRAKEALRDELLKDGEALGEDINKLLGL